MVGSSSAPAWTPREVADRCEALGARVELKGTKYRVYPPDGGQPVFFNAQRETNGSHLPNVLRDLRRNGLDLQDAEREAQERRKSERAPEPMTQRLAPEVVAAVAATRTTTDRRTTVATPNDVPRIPFDARREMAELRDMVRKQGDDALEMLAAAERRIEALEDQLADIMAGRTVRPPSVSELVRRAVLAWFEAHPGMKITPQLLEMQNDIALPEGYGRTMVAGACRDLAMAAKLDGGGPRSGEGAARGVYWLAEPAPVEPES